MKTQRNILIAFVLNTFFALFELFGGLYTSSVAIVSDAVHDMGDAVSIGVSYLLEKKSRKQPDKSHTYGYLRYSVLGGVITTVILLFSSVLVIYKSVLRIFEPDEINYDGMIVFAIIGVAVNFAAAWFTHGGDSVNQRAVNLHMLEDVLGWIVVLAGAVIMKLTDLSIIDPLMSVGVALFILTNAVKNLKRVLDLFLEKMPEGIDVQRIKIHLAEIEGIEDVHHIHIRSIDGYRNYATMHIVVKEGANMYSVKENVREELMKLDVCHCTIETETAGERCIEEECVIRHSLSYGCHCHNHK